MVPHAYDLIWDQFQKIRWVINYNDMEQVVIWGLGDTVTEAENYRYRLIALSVACMNVECISSRQPNEARYWWSCLLNNYTHRLGFLILSQNLISIRCCAHWISLISKSECGKQSRPLILDFNLKASGCRCCSSWTVQCYTDGMIPRDLCERSTASEQLGSGIVSLPSWRCSQLRGGWRCPWLVSLHGYLVSRNEVGEGRQSILKWDAYRVLLGRWKGFWKRWGHACRKNNFHVKCFWD